MPYEIQWLPGCMHRRYYGHLTGRELVRCIEEVTEDARFDNLRFTIGDFLGVESFEVGEDDLTMAAALRIGASRTNGAIFAALVAQRPEIVDLVTRYLEPSRWIYVTTVHSTMEDARAWIAARALPASQAVDDAAPPPDGAAG